MESFSKNFEVQFNTETDPQKNLLMWILREFVIIANDNDEDFSFRGSAPIRVTQSNGEFTILNSENIKSLSFTISDILRDVFGFTRFKMDFSDIFKKDVDYQFLDEMLYNASYTVVEDDIQTIKSDGYLTSNNITQISSLSKKTQSYKDGELLDRIVGFLENHCLNIDPFDIFIRRASIHLMHRITDIEQKQFEDPISNFNFLVDEFNGHVDDYVWIEKKYESIHFNTMNLLGMKSGMPVKSVSRTTASFNDIYWEFKCALLKCFGISDPLSNYVKDDDIRDIWNVYLNINHWKTFCLVNKITHDDFKLQRQAISFSDSSNPTSNLDFRKQIKQAIKDHNKSCYIKFRNYPSLSLYRECFPSMILTSVQHMDICKIIESNVRIFTVADIIDHWKGIHQNHVTLSGETSTFSFASILL
jgi:hypothetical protein